MDEETRRFTVDLDPSNLPAFFRQLGDRVTGLVEQGRYTKVRLRYKGQQLGPDIPVGALVAGEALSMWLMGPLRAVLMTLSFGTVLEVELVYEPSELVRTAQAHYERGELDAAEIALRKALARWPDDPMALYQLGALLRITGRRDEAIDCLKKAAAAGDHPSAKKARETLQRMSERL